MIQLVIIYQIIPIARVSPRGGAASGDPSYPRLIHPPFTQKNLQFIHRQINTPFGVRLHDVQNKQRKELFLRKTDAKTRNLTRIRKNLKSKN